MGETAQSLLLLQHAVASHRMHSPSADFFEEVGFLFCTTSGVVPGPALCVSPWSFLATGNQIQAPSLSRCASWAFSLPAPPTQALTIGGNEACELWPVFGLLPAYYALASAKNDFHILITDEKSQEYFMMWKS